MLNKIRFNITDSTYLVYLQKKNNMDNQTQKRQIKVIHVHFLKGRKNYYFGSVSAVYRKFSEEEIGCCEQYARQQLSQDGNIFINNKVMIIRSRLIR